MSLVVVRPVPVTDAMMIAAAIDENDYPAWASGTAYALGARVILTSTHRVYESLQASNTGHDPRTSPTWWIEVGPTNKWRPFDASNSTQAARASSITYQLRPGQAITAFAALNLTGATSIRVRMVDPDARYGTVYDRTTDLSAVPLASDWWSWVFGARFSPSRHVALDLPAFPNADLYVDISGTSALAAGVLMFGQQQSIGMGVQFGARTGIRDYSRKEVNDYGDTVLVQRAFAKRANFDMLVPAAEVDYVQALLAQLRATPCLWVGSEDYESTAVFGFYRDFEVLISYPTVSECSIEIEGLT